MKIEGAIQEYKNSFFLFLLPNTGAIQLEKVAIQERSHKGVLKLWPQSIFLQRLK